MILWKGNAPSMTRHAAEMGEIFSQLAKDLSSSSRHREAGEANEDLNISAPSDFKRFTISSNDRLLPL